MENPLVIFISYSSKIYPHDHPHRYDYVQDVRLHLRLHLVGHLSFLRLRLVGHLSLLLLLRCFYLHQRFALLHPGLNAQFRAYAPVAAPAAMCVCVCVCVRVWYDRSCP